MLHRIRSRPLELSFLVLSLAACGPDDSATAPAASPAPAAAESPRAGSESAVQEARQIFDTRCVACHGPQGKGDGPASSGLTPPPRNFHDKLWQSSVTDEHIEQIIQYGGAAVGKSPAMPSNPDLAAKPEVVVALRAHLRELGDE
jgi:mono/diheme cytochrome c family protein